MVHFSEARAGGFFGCVVIIGLISKRTCVENGPPLVLGKDIECLYWQVLVFIEPSSSFSFFRIALLKSSQEEKMCFLFLWENNLTRYCWLERKMEAGEIC